ncbi:exonuclease subunit SbcD, partial [Myxococcota bacterium]|nr:exonuclease subunit SbcD [Myxococcota bacterium]
MRILHTADWHLGQTLHGTSRAWEHERFFAWLLDALAREQIDALVVAGDVFDTANPSPAALTQYYGFLAAARARCPRLDIVVVGGNHDSPERLDAPRSLLALDPIRVTVVGALPRTPSGDVDLERAIVPLHGARGEVGAWLLAVPFLRRGDLPDLDTPGLDEDPALAERTLTRAYAALYRRLVDLALAKRAPGQALVATGHCYMVGGRTSELSERKIQVGNQDALPVEIFPKELAYVALGHLHYAQSVHGRENVRYSGSPIPLSLTERTYEHQVLAVDLEDGWISRPPKRLVVPRAVELLSIPDAHAPLDAVLTALRALPRERPAGAPDAARPYLEVKVA